MTLITISRLPNTASSPPQTLPLSLQLTGKSCSAEADRFSLNSNLSASSPHSSITSPLSTEYNGSQVSICCSAEGNSSCTSPTNAGSCLITSTFPETERELEHERIRKQSLQPLQPQQLQKHNHQCNKHHSPNYNNNFHHHNHHRNQIIQQPLSLPQEPVKTRRLSRSEHRQSLSDLGYGKIESYAKLQRLGKGTYATVYMGRSRLNNDLVALKEILKEHDEGAPCTAIREVSLLRLLRHNNIVTLHDICHTPNKLTLVFEYVGPDLYAYMKENNHLLSIHNVRVSRFFINTSYGYVISSHHVIMPTPVFFQTII